MRTPLIALAFALTAASCATTPVATEYSQAQSDVAEIRALQQAQADAWNAHDIDAYAALFTEDAQVINVLGWHWRSRAELEHKLGSGFAWVFAESTLTVEGVETYALGSNTAVAHVRWTLTGARSPTGAQGDVPQQGVQTQVLRREDGRWRIAFFQNTNSVPERDMPLGPQR